MKKLFAVMVLALLIVTSAWAVDTRVDNKPKTDDVIIIIKVPRDADSKSLEPDVPDELTANGMIRCYTPIYDAGYSGDNFDAETAIRDTEFCLVMMTVPKENVIAVTDVLWSYPTAEVETITAVKEATAKIEFTMFDTVKAQIEADIADSDNRVAEIVP